MNVLKYSICRFAILLFLFAQEALGDDIVSWPNNVMCAMYCEYSAKDETTPIQWGTSNSGNGVWPCFPATKPTCTVTTLDCTPKSFTDWKYFTAMYSFQAKCDVGARIGLCTYDSDGSWYEISYCANGEEAAGFCIGDNQRRRLGEPIYQEGSQMEVEIDGVAMVIWNSKEQE